MGFTEINGKWVSKDGEQGGSSSGLHAEQKMKLPDLSGKVIVIKSDQQEVKRCYENSLKTNRGYSCHGAPTYRG